MPENVFTAGVRPGGVTTSTEIRILICYLIANAETSPTVAEVEASLLKSELVNYFELAANLAELSENGLILLDSEQRCTLSKEGRQISDTLQNDIPYSVRERAKKTLSQLQKTARNIHYYDADIIPCENGYHVRCSMQDMGQPVFSFSIYMPDSDSAEQAKQQFIQKGADLYKLMVSALTGSSTLLEMVLQGLTV